MNAIRFRLRRVTLLAGLHIACVATGAAPVGELTLRDAVARTEQRNPVLAGSALETEIVSQRARVRSFAPATTIDVEVENFAGTGEMSGVRSLETTLQLSKVMELGSRAQSRRDLGTTEIEGARSAQAAVRADIVAETARRFIHVLSDQTRLEVMRRSTALAATAREVVQARIREGAISPVFLNRAEIAFARARIAAEHAEHELAASRVALSVMWAEPAADFERVTGTLFAFAELEPLEGYLARLDSNPDVLKFVADQRVLEARARLAEAQRLPTVTLSAGVRRLEGLDDQALVAGFSIPIGTRERARPEIVGLQAEREQLRFKEHARRLELQSLLFSLYQEILHARNEADTLHVDIRPQAKRMVSTTAEGYRLGRYSLIELIDAQRQLAEVELDAIRAAVEFHTNLIEIERITGVSVAKVTP
jgi:outer membrane protein, heavy metal efflux system